MGRRTRPTWPDPDDPLGAVDQILADPGFVWFGVKHYSPACALHVRRTILEREPVAVLIEGPDDANELIPWMVHADTRPPFTVLSSWVDKRNKLGRNGELSAAPDVPARYRGWWPFVSHGPEYAAVRAGHEVGARVAFIDASLKAQLPTMHGAERQPNDRDLGESAYVKALARAAGHDDFRKTWEARIEAGAASLATDDFRRRVLVFAWCARNVGAGDVAESTALREGHMRWHIDQVRKELPEGEIVVVTGAYHSVALPFLKGKRAPGKPDKDTSTLLCAHSFRALSRLSGEHPAWGDAVMAAAMAGEPHPQDVAALRVLVDAAGRARDAGAPIGTADAVGALSVARHLAALRGQREVGPEEVLDAVRAAFVKGDIASAGRPVLTAARVALTGARMGEVAEGAGRPPLMDDYYAQAKDARLDLSGAEKMVRCDVHKQPAHRRKSAFLHACRILAIPMFGAIEGTGEPFKGPDLATGERLDLTTETWAVRWDEEVDDRLVEIADRGTTIAEAAAERLRAHLEAAGTDVGQVGRRVLEIAQVRAGMLLPLALDRLLAAAAVDAQLEHLVAALEDVVLLQGYRDALDTVGDERLVEAMGALFSRACLALPGARHVADEEASDQVERLQTLVRIAVAAPLPAAERGSPSEVSPNQVGLTERPFGGDPSTQSTRVPGETARRPGRSAAERGSPSEVSPNQGVHAFDRALLVQRLADMVRDDDAQPLVRGAGQGVLHAMGATSDRALTEALRSYLDGPIERVLRGGAFLEGVLRVQRSAFMSSPRLLRTVHAVLARLDEEAFARILPDLRRAFSVFIPAELEAIGGRVADELLRADGTEGDDPDAPVPEADLEHARRIDADVRRLLQPWLASVSFS